MRRTGWWLYGIVAAVLFAVWTFVAFTAGKRSVIIPEIVHTSDTVIVRETIRDTVRVPVVKYIVRVDTVRMKIPDDTVRVEVEVPIERKVYLTEDYRATIEGFRPTLVDMEIYRRTKYVTKTETIRVPVKRRWGIGIQAGYGYNFDRFYPYVGIGLQYTIVSW